ncbi:hypothetical protein TrRE_jg11221 [Triparma retinervis]|uniref:NADP-dependent oxidoreductase domain-containing protein n=1 Tax=Triparma retinervis TaxID=2557542 RepID=A0A9W7E3Z6_9STRA|nr:hypothetical protein TrRE_jg11221 [Triparma retinervis]
MPIVNYFTVSPWNSSMQKVRFCHSRGIQCLVRFIWDVNVSNGAGNGPPDPTVAKIAQEHERSAMQVLCLWALNRGLVIFPDLDHVKGGGLMRTAEEFDKWRVNLSTALKELSILLSPLFRKKPLWKEAFCLHEKEEESIDNLDGAFWAKVNDTLMTKKPGGFKFKGKVRREDDGEGGEEEDAGEDTGAWEGEYKEFFDKQKRDKEEEEKRNTAGEGGNDEAGGVLSIIRNVETKSRIVTDGEIMERKIGQGTHSKFAPEEDSIELSVTKLDIMDVGAGSIASSMEDGNIQIM